MRESNVKTHFETLAKSWGSTIVARDQVPVFTGGAISSGRMANLDCMGEGPKERIRIGRKICYPVDVFIEWLSERSEILPQKNRPVETAGVWEE
jgi:hypothetical protein